MHMTIYARHHMSRHFTPVTYKFSACIRLEFNMKYSIVINRRCEQALTTTTSRGELQLTRFESQY